VRIARVEAVPLEARLKTPFRFGSVVRTTSANVLVRITGEDGVVGYGEACPVPQLTAETQESVVALVEQRVTPELLGEDALRWRPLLERVAERLFQASFTLAAVDMALLDLAGKRLGVPVHVLLGGRCRDAIEVHGSVGWDADPERMADTAERQAPEFRWLKLYAGTGTLEEDLERIAAVRRRVGDGHALLLDVNGQCINVGISKLGGIVAALDTATAARSGFLDTAVGSVVELGVATAAGLQLAAVLPDVAYPSYLIGSRKYARQITSSPFEVVHGHLAIGTAPGLGVDVDEEAVAAMDLRRP